MLPASKQFVERVRQLYEQEPREDASCRLGGYVCRWIRSVTSGLAVSVTLPVTTLMLSPPCASCLQGSRRGAHSAQRSRAPRPRHPLCDGTPSGSSLRTTAAYRAQSWHGSASGHLLWIVIADRKQSPHWAHSRNIHGMARLQYRYDKTIGIRSGRQSLSHGCCGQSRIGHLLGTGLDTRRLRIRADLIVPS